VRGDSNELFFEGDSLNVVKVLRQDGRCLNRFGQLIEDVRTMLCSVQFTEVKHIRREANSVVHRLARNVLLSLFGNPSKQF